MSKVKIANNQLLGVHEMNRLVEYLREGGFYNMFLEMNGNLNWYYNDTNVQGGIVRNADGTDLPFSSLKVSVDGSYNVLVEEGKAFDTSGNFINQDQGQQNVATHSDTVGTTYYTKIAYNTKKIEEGTVSIAANGAITGSSTKFTEYARNQGNVPLKVEFPDSAGNTGEYEIIEVTSDTAMVVNPGISGSMTIEVGKTISVIGAFTPGKTISAGDKNIYVLDSFTLTHDTNAPTSDEILLATVERTGSAVTVTDYRQKSVIPQTNILQHSEHTWGNFSVENPVVGFTEIYCDEDFGSRTNKARIQWGFKSTTGNWSKLTSTTLTVNVGSGGAYDVVADVGSQEFKGWYLYQSDTTSGNLQLIGKVISAPASLASVYVAIENGIELDTTKDIIFLPDAHHISILITDAGATTHENARVWSFPITDFEAWIDLKVPTGVASTTLNVKYKHKKGRFDLPWVNIPAGQYIGEEEWDYPNMVTNGSSTTSYGAGTINLKSKTNHRWVNNKQPFSLVNSWVNDAAYGTQSGYFYNEKTGMVHLWGMLDAASATNSLFSTIGNLGLLPDPTIYAASISVWPIHSLTNGAHTQLTINSATHASPGQCKITTYGTDKWNLNGICWFPEPDQFDIV